MPLEVTLTGSYPAPLNRPVTDEDIRQAVRDQTQAGMTVLVDGQLRADIAGLFAPVVAPGDSVALPLKVTGKIKPLHSGITVDDYKIAKIEAGKRQVKAHLTGPTFLAENCRINDALYQGPTDSALIYDIAEALAAEAQFLCAAGATIIQIDEPTLAYGPDVKVALKALEIIVRKIPFSILHTCGDVTDIFQQLLDAPVQVLNVEWEHLRGLDWANCRLLENHEKKIALGCLAVDTDTIESLPRIRQIVMTAVNRFGDCLWGLTPNCGLRLSTRDLAMRRMQILVQAAKDAQL